MSLHNAAKHIAAHGRGEDTVLVHMTPKEVGSLQAVAKAHGGSLTINPHTGLAEAGFLKGLLPTLLGAGLAATGVGAPMAALMVGGGYAAASGGDLKKGLMAGLGAYGGAGMYGAMNPAAVPTPATPVPTTPSAPVVSSPAPVGGANISSLGTGTYPTIPNMAAPTITPTPAPMTLESLTQPAVGSPAQIAQQSMAPAVQPTNLATTATTPSYTPAGKSFEDAAMSKYGAASAASTVAGSQEPPKAPTPADPGMIRPYTFDRTRNENAFLNTTSGAPLSSKEQRYFNDTYTAQTPYKAPGPEYMAAGGPVEQMSNNATIGANTMYPMANMTTSAFATPYQDPRATNMMSAIAPAGGGVVDAMSGEPNMQGTRLASGGEIKRFGLGGLNIDESFNAPNAPEDGIGAMLNMMGKQKRAQQGNPRQYTYDPQSQQYTEIQQGTPVPAYAMGGSLGGYSDGGRMLKGPGDGMSDNIPATIGNKQPARLADGEFVVPADVVSHLGNGSTDAGAKQLYAMMDKIRAARTGTKKQGKQINPRKYMPA